MECGSIPLLSANVARAGRRLDSKPDRAGFDTLVQRHLCLCPRRGRRLRTAFPRFESLQGRHALVAELVLAPGS